MKAILLMLGALSAAIIFVGCGTAVGRATGVSDSKGSATLAAPNFGEPKAAAIDEEMVRALISDEIKKSRPMFEAMVVEEITDSQFQVEELGLMLQELRTQLQSVRELEPILSDIPEIKSHVQGLQRSIIEAERVLEEIQNSNDGFQTSIQGAHDLFEEEVSRNISHLAIQLEGYVSNQNPAAASKALICLSDLECFANLNALSALADNDYREADIDEIYRLYDGLNSEGWDVYVLSEAHRFALLLHRQLASGDGIKQEVSCYRIPDCKTRIQRFVELMYEAEEIGFWSEDSREIRAELEEIDRNLGQDLEYVFYEGERGLISGRAHNNLKILFSPAHEEIIRMWGQIQPSDLTRMVNDEP